MKTKCSWGYSYNASLLGPSKKDLPVPFSLVKKSIFPDTQLKAELTDLKIARIFPILMSRIRMMNTFITPHV